MARGGAPFYHVVIVGECRIPPPDVDGHVFSKTCIYVTPGALLFEPLRDLQHAKARRAFVRGATQATTWPLLLSSGRGQEVYYAPMKGRWAPLGGAGRSSPARRPCGPADAERAHIEYSREIGIFLHEVFRCAPGQWGELLPLAEFVMWNSPGKTSLAPRDLCMGWSLASPLERELLPLEPAKREAVSDVAAAQFEQFRRLPYTYLQHRARAGRRRAELANRTRSPRKPEVRGVVMQRDPKLAKAAAGHAPGRRPLRGPFEVAATNGNAACLLARLGQRVVDGGGAAGEGRMLQSRSVSSCQANGVSRATE